MVSLRDWVESEDRETMLLMAEMGEYSLCGVGKNGEKCAPGRCYEVPERRAFLGSVVAVYADTEYDEDLLSLAVVEFQDGRFGYVSRDIIYAASLDEIRDLLDEDGKQRLVWLTTPIRK